MNCTFSFLFLFTLYTKCTKQAKLKAFDNQNKKRKYDEIIHTFCSSNVDIFKVQYVYSNSTGSTKYIKTEIFEVCTTG